MTRMAGAACLMLIACFAPSQINYAMRMMGKPRLETTLQHVLSIPCPLYSGFHWILRIQSVIHSYFDNVMTKFIVNDRTDAWKPYVNLFFTITSCQIVRSRSLPHRKNYKFLSVRLLTMKISQWARENFCSYRKTLSLENQWGRTQRRTQPKWTVVSAQTWYVKSHMQL